jgi:hypothetical protein
VSLRPSRLFWLIAALLYGTLMYSTGLHYAYGPEDSVSTTFLDRSETVLPPGHYPAEGSLHGDLPPLDGSETWRLSSAPSDAAYYLLQVDSLGASIAPYKYRVFPTLLVRGLQSVTGWEAAEAYSAMNTAFVWSTALLFTWYLLSCFGFGSLLSLLGGVLFVTMISVTRTLPFPMTEPASLFFSLVLYVAAARSNAWLFAVAAVLGVATKEVLLMGTFLWLAARYPFSSWTSFARAAAVAAIPVLAFAGIRLALGGSAMEVNYGFSLLQGEFPSYGRRLLHLHGIWAVSVKILFAFGILWAGLLVVRRNPFLLRASVTIPVVLGAAVLLSGQLVRVIGVVFPVVIPLFLLLLTDALPDDHSARMHRQPERPEYAES